MAWIARCCRGGAPNGLPVNMLVFVGRKRCSQASRVRSRPVCRAWWWFRCRTVPLILSVTRKRSGHILHFLSWFGQPRSAATGDRNNSRLDGRQDHRIAPAEHR